MREYTKQIKKEAEKDIGKISQRNNSKWEKMNESQQQAHIADKKRSFTSKWEALQKEAETVAQKRICNRMLAAIEKYTR